MENIVENNRIIAEFMGGIYVRREDLFDSHIIEEIIYNNNHPILKNNIKTTLFFENPDTENSRDEKYFNYQIKQYFYKNINLPRWRNW